MASEKQYLGDGAYVEFDGWALVLTTEDGIAVQNRIVLESNVYAALQEFAARAWPPVTGEKRDGES